MQNNNNNNVQQSHIQSVNPSKSLLMPSNSKSNINNANYTSYKVFTNGSNVYITKKSNNTNNNNINNSKDWNIGTNKINISGLNSKIFRSPTDKNVKKKSKLSPVGATLNLNDNTYSSPGKNKDLQLLKSEYNFNYELKSKFSNNNNANNNDKNPHHNNSTIAKNFLIVTNELSKSHNINNNNNDTELHRINSKSYLPIVNNSNSNNPNNANHSLMRDYSRDDVSKDKK